MSVKHLFSTGLWLSAALLGGVLCARAEGNPTEVTLRGGDRLSGEVVAASPDALRLRPYWAEEAFELPFSELSQFVRPGPAADPLESFLIVHFKSGDRILARDLTGQDGDMLRITTRTDQVLELKKEELHAVRFYDQERLWAQPVSADPSFPTSGGRARLETGGPGYQTTPVTCSDSFLVEVDLQVPDGDYQMQLQFFDDPDRQNLSRLVVELSERRISAAWFRSVVNQGFRVESWQADQPVRDSHLYLRLFADMKNNRYTLFLNDQLIKSWEVEHLGTLLRGASAPIQLRATSGMDPIRLNALRVLGWKGEPVPPAFLRPARGKETVLILADGSELKGTVREIGPESIRIQPAGTSGERVVARSEVFEMVFPERTNLKPAPRSTNTVKLSLDHPEESMSATRMEIEGGVLRARVEWAEDPLTLPLAAVRGAEYPSGERDTARETNVQTDSHSLRLLNGDELSGRYLGQEAAWLLFQTTWKTAPLRIHGKYVERLRFAHRKPPSGEGWNVTLGNGDVLSGRLLGKTETDIEVETEWSDRLRIRIPQVKSLHRRVPGEQLLERGPSSMDDWVYTNRREAALMGNEKDFKASAEGWWLRRRGMVQKRLPAVRGSFMFSVRLYLPPSAGTGGGAGIALTALPNEEGGYRMLQLTQRGDHWIFNLTDPERSGSGDVALTSVTPDAEGEHLFVFAFDHDRKHLQIRANGEVAHEWKDDESSHTAEPYSPMITFSVTGSHSGILIREWMLYDLEHARAHPPAPPATRDSAQVWLSNGDQLEGTWSGLTEKGEWRITPAGSNESFSLSPERIQGFVFAAGREEHIKRKAGHIRVILNGGVEQFIAELISADATAFRIRREGWEGSGTLPLDQVERVEFNPYWTETRTLSH